MKFILKPLHRWLYLLLFLGVSVTLTTVVLSAYVRATTTRDRYTTPADVPSVPVAIVFGAGVGRDGNPSLMLADRLHAAASLYKLGRVQKLLMTGDNSRLDYNEVAVMQRYAEQRGVKTADITLDYAGFSTYESCYRAKEIFGVQQAVLVTQQFHLSRAVYTCRKLGVEAVGLGTLDWGKYGVPVMVSYTLREILATVKALGEVYITRPKPTFLGPFEGIK